MAWAPSAIKASPTPGMRATAYATTVKARFQRAFLFLCTNVALNSIATAKGKPPLQLIK